MKKYDVYAIGNALVDIEYHAEESKLNELGIEKGLMTLIDESKQNSLIRHLGDSHESMACGGSAANTIIAIAQMGGETHFDCRVANDITGQFFADDLKQSGVYSKIAGSAVQVLILRSSLRGSQETIRLPWDTAQISWYAGETRFWIMPQPSTQ